MRQVHAPKARRPFHAADHRQRPAEAGVRFTLNSARLSESQTQYVRK
jgi:hypothetical protein